MLIRIEYVFVNLLALLFLLVNLAACVPKEDNSRTERTEQMTPAVVSLVKVTSTPEPTKTEKPTSTPQVTSTSTPLLSRTFTPTSSPTLSPTVATTTTDILEEVEDPSSTNWRMVLIEEVGNAIFAMTKDQNGSIWLEEAICGTLMVKISEKGPEVSITDISALLYDRQGNLWIAGGVLANQVQHAGVIKYDGENLTEFLSTASENSPSFEPAIPYGTSFMLIEDNNGNIWVSTEDAPEIAIYDGQEFFKVRPKEFGAATDNLKPIFASSGGNIWLSGEGSIYIWDGQNLRLFTEDNGWLPGFMITAMAEDNQGTVWIAGSFDRSTNWAIMHFKDEQFTPFQLPESIDRSPPAADILYGPRSGGMWIILRDVAHWLKGDKVLTLVGGQDLPAFGVRTVVEDDQDRMWFGGLDGVSRYERSLMDGNETTGSPLFPTSPIEIPTRVHPPKKQKLLDNLPYNGPGYSIQYTVWGDEIYISIGEAPIEQTKQRALDYLATYGFNDPEKELNVRYNIPRTLQHLVTPTR